MGFHWNQRNNSLARLPLLAVLRAEWKLHSVIKFPACLLTMFVVFGCEKPAKPLFDPVAQQAKDKATIAKKSVVEDATSNEQGVYFYRNMYSTTIVELKEGHFRYWASSCGNLIDLSRFPLGGNYTRQGANITLQLHEVYVSEMVRNMAPEMEAPIRSLYKTNQTVSGFIPERWTLQRVNGTLTLWNWFAMKDWREKRDWNPYGVIIKVDAVPDRLWTNYRSVVKIP